MRKIILLFGLLLVAWMPASKADTSFIEAFHQHNAIKLLIDPNNGKIIEANEAAEFFYGYPSLTSMTIQQINQLSPEQVAAERKLAETEGRNFFIFRHKLADSTIKTVEVHSSPVIYQNSKYLFSIIKDISAQRSMEQELWHYQSQLEYLVAKQTKKIKTASNILQALMSVVVVVLLLIVILMSRFIRLKKQSELKLLESKKLYDLAVEGTGVGIWSWNAITGENYCSDQFFELLGFRSNEIEPTFKMWRKIIHPDDKQIVSSAFKAHLPNNENYDMELRLRKKEGEYRWFHLMGHALRDKNNNPIEIAGSLQDITERKQADRTIIDANQKLETIVNSATVAIAWSNKNNEIEFVNPAFKQIFGWELSDIPTTTSWFRKAYKNNKYRKKVIAEWQQKVKKSHLNHGTIDSMEVEITCKDGSLRYMLLNGVWSGELLITIFSDISKQKDRQDEIQRAAFHDTLTGLPNRDSLTKQLKHSIHRSISKGNKLGIAFLDLDGFKVINDKYGHKAGDHVLQQVSARLLKHLREGDTVGRWGGDEFSLILSDLKETKDAYHCLDRIIKSVSQPIFYDDHTLHISVSIGVTFFPQQINVDGEQLLKQADHAMYEAKQKGKNQYRVFNQNHHF